MGLSHELIVPLPSKADPIASIVPLVLSTEEVLLGLCLRKGHTGLREAADFFLFTAHSSAFLSVRSHPGRLHPSPVYPAAAVLAGFWNSVLLLVCFPFNFLAFCCFWRC